MIRSVPSRTESPLLTLMAVTVPSRSALMLFSIFMASRMSSVCPFLTASPTWTLMSSMTPGNGDLIPLLRAVGLGAGLAGAAGLCTSCTTGFTSGFGAASNSTLYFVPLTSTSARLSFTLFMATLYVLPLILYLNSFMCCCFFVVTVWDLS